MTQLHYTVWLAPLILIYFIIRRNFAYFTYYRKLRALKCQAANHYRHLDPILGYDFYKQTNQAKAEGRLVALLQNRYRKYGKTFQAGFLGVETIYTSDVVNIQAINTIFFDKFEVGPFRRPANSDWVGEGIFISDGEFWRKARKVIMPVFAKANVANLEGFSELVRRMMELLPGEGEPVDLRPLFKRLFLDSSTEFLFGESANTLRPNDVAKLNAEEFLTSFDKAMGGVDHRMSLAGLSSLYGRATQDAEWRQAISTVHSYVDKHIDEALIEQSQDKVSQLKDDDFAKSASGNVHTKTRPFSVLSELVKETTDRKFLRDQLTSLFFPSRDATGIGLSGLFFNLARNPHVWTKVREEVLSPENREQALTFETLKSMKYLQSVLNESLRLLAPASLASRVCTTDTVLPHGGGAHGDLPILVQADTQVDMHFGVMQRDPDFWGSDAEQFRPERWEVPGFRPKWEYIPFLGGGRICPAQQMVLNQMGFVLATFARKFTRIENRDPEERFVEEYIFSVQSRNGVQVAFT